MEKARLGEVGLLKNYPSVHAHLEIQGLQREPSDLSKQENLHQKAPKGGDLNEIQHF